MENLIFTLRILLVFMVLLGTFLVANYIYIMEKESELKKEQETLLILEEQRKIEEEKERIELEKAKIFQSCMMSPYQKEGLQTEINQLLNEYKNKNLGFYFEDIQNGYTIKKDETKTYFGASVIKLVEVLYLLNESIEGRLDLSTPIKYEKRHTFVFSSEMEKHKVGEEIPLRDIMRYAITVSDNTAHMMLFEYIGLDKLYAYANQIQVKITATNKDRFGNLRAIDGYNLLIQKKVYFWKKL